MSFSRLNLGTKLAFAFGITLVLLLVIAVMGIKGMGDVNEDLQQIVEVENIKVKVANTLVDRSNAVYIAMRDIIISEDLEFCKNQNAVIEKARADIAQSLETLTKMVDAGEGKQHLAAVKEVLSAAKEVNVRVLALGLANRNEEARKVLLQEAGPIGRKTIEAVDRLVQYETRLTEKKAAEAKGDYSFSRLVMLCVSALAFVVGVLFAFFLTRSITKPIQRVTEGLASGAEQVAAASGQVASSSQNLAEGASEQAASIEEASSSLEEISSMTRQNAETANNANQIMHETAKVVSSASEAMNQLTSSMIEISRASEETQKIVKTIDEISFQTNLLALNAAVEAARAGEAGAGFAVVADEVRNLAMRAADAAKSTANLIEGTVKKITEGSEIVEKTGSEFSRVVTSTAKMGELIGEIAAASREQAQGIEQVSKGISEMDKVVQQNAANAEESASASEEMNAQAEQMKMHVGELEAVIGGSANGSAKSWEAAAARNGKENPHSRTAFMPAQNKGKAHKRALEAPRVSPEQVIPMDNADFSF